jgi:hypothetical protein
VSRPSPFAYADAALLPHGFLILDMDTVEVPLVPTPAKVGLISQHISCEFGLCTPGCAAVDQTPGPLHDTALKEADSFLVRA